MHQESLESKDRAAQDGEPYAYLYRGEGLTPPYVTATREALFAILGRHFFEPWVPDVLREMARQNPDLILNHNDEVRKHPSGDEVLREAWNCSLSSE